MKKKSLLTMVLALALVGAVGIGATLAYLSDTTTELKNTFTVGSGIDIKQDESNEKTPDDPTDRTEIGNEYTDIMPGEVLVKDPTVTVVKGSNDCYVFMQLSGADALEGKGFAFGSVVVQGEGEEAKEVFVKGLSSAWNKVDDSKNLDGLYVYNDYAKVAQNNDDDTKLPALFSAVQYDMDVTEVKAVNKDEVKIMSCAVQADNMDEEAALAAAQKVMAE